MLLYLLNLQLTSNCICEVICFPRFLIGNSFMATGSSIIYVWLHAVFTILISINYIVWGGGLLVPRLFYPQAYICSHLTAWLYIILTASACLPICCFSKACTWLLLNNLTKVCILIYYKQEAHFRQRLWETLTMHNTECTRSYGMLAAYAFPLNITVLVLHIVFTQGGVGKGRREIRRERRKRNLILTCTSHNCHCTDFWKYFWICI